MSEYAEFRWLLKKGKDGKITFDDKPDGCYKNNNLRKK